MLFLGPVVEYSRLVVRALASVEGSAAPDRATQNVHPNPLDCRSASVLRLPPSELNPFVPDILRIGYEGFPKGYQVPLYQLLP